MDWHALVSATHWLALMDLLNLPCMIPQELGFARQGGRNPTDQAVGRSPRTLLIIIRKSRLLSQRPQICADLISIRRQ